MAFKEVLVILNYIPKADYEKIPDDIIQTLKNNADALYNFSLDLEKNINEQNISELAKAIIGNFYRDYWITDVERKKILQEENLKRKEIEEEKRKKYNSNDIFKTSNNDKKNNFELETEDKNLIEIKENKWYKKIILRLKKFFTKYYK
jgi:hypothetical protein